MAKKLCTITIDDLDGAELGASDAVTVLWSWQGVDYEFDTAIATRDALSNGDRDITLMSLLTGSRRIGLSRRQTRPRVRAAVGPTANQSRTIRDWCRGKGIPVSSRGRIPAHLMAAYSDAHQRTLCDLRLTTDPPPVESR